MTSGDVAFLGAIHGFGPAGKAEPEVAELHEYDVSAVHVHKGQNEWHHEREGDSVAFSLFFLDLQAPVLIY